MLSIISPPGVDEYADFHRGYISRVEHEPDGAAVLERQREQIERLRQLAPALGDYRYAEGKWSVKEVIGHLADSERVFSYRLLRIARGDTTPLPGFDEQVVAAGSNAARRALGDLVDELGAVRAATLALVRSLDEEAMGRRAAVNNWSLTARAIVFITAGHFAHHAQVLRERYGIGL